MEKMARSCSWTLTDLPSLCLIISLSNPCLTFGNCKSQVRNELLKMKGWKAAESNGKPIESKYPLSISCLSWSN